VELKLPKATKHEKDPPHKANYIIVEANGNLWLNKAKVSIEELQATLLALRENDPDLNVLVRVTPRPNTSRSVPCWMRARQSTSRGGPDDRTSPQTLTDAPAIPIAQKAQLVEGQFADLFAFHGLLVLVVLYFAARSGLLGTQLKKITVTMEKKEKPPEKPKERRRSSRRKPSNRRKLWKHRKWSPARRRAAGGGTTRRRITFLDFEAASWCKAVLIPCSFTRGCSNTPCAPMEPADGHGR